MSKKQIYARYGVSDILVTVEEMNQGDFMNHENTYFIGYEDEDGNECQENGDPL